MDSPEQQEVLARINASLSSTALRDIVLAEATLLGLSLDGYDASGEAARAAVMRDALANRPATTGYADVAAFTRAFDAMVVGEAALFRAVAVANDLDAAPAALIDEVQAVVLTLKGLDGTGVGTLSGQQVSSLVSYGDALISIYEGFDHPGQHAFVTFLMSLRPTSGYTSFGQVMTVVQANAYTAYTVGKQADVVGKAALADINAAAGLEEFDPALREGAEALAMDLSGLLQLDATTQATVLGELWAARPASGFATVSALNTPFESVVQAALDSVVVEPPQLPEQPVVPNPDNSGETTMYTDLWTLQGEQVSIAVDGLYQNWYLSAMHISRYGTAALMVNQSQWDETTQQYLERREILLVDLETQLVLDRGELAPNAFLIPTGDGAPEFLIGTLVNDESGGGSLTLQMADAMPGSSTLGDAIGTVATLQLSAELAQTLSQSWNRIYLAKDVGSEGETPRDYLIVSASDASQVTQVTIHPVSSGVVGEAVASQSGWLNEFFVNGDQIWLSMWNGSNVDHWAFDSLSAGVGQVSQDDFYNQRNVALDVGTIVREGELVIDLRALGLTIPPDAEVWTDMDWAVETLSDGSVLIRPEVVPDGADTGYEHWIVVSAQGQLVAEHAFSQRAGPLLRALGDEVDGYIYFQVINAVEDADGSLLQNADAALGLYRIAEEEVASVLQAASTAQLDTLVGVQGVDTVGTYSLAQLTGETYTTPYPLLPFQVAVIDLYGQLEGGGAFSVVTLANLKVYGDLTSNIMLTRPLATGGEEASVITTSGELEGLLYLPQVDAGALFYREFLDNGQTLHTRLDLASGRIDGISWQAYQRLEIAAGQAQAADVVGFDAAGLPGLQISADDLQTAGKLPAQLDIAALYLDWPDWVVSPWETMDRFAVARVGYLGAEGSEGSVILSLAFDSVAQQWHWTDAFVTSAQVVDTEKDYATADGSLEAIELTLLDPNSTSIEVSSLTIDASGAAFSCETIGTLPLVTALDSLGLSPHAEITFSFGPRGVAQVVSGGESFRQALVLRSFDPTVPAERSPVEFRASMYDIFEDETTGLVTATLVDDTLGLRSLPAYQTSGIIAYEPAGLFDDSAPNEIVFIGVDGDAVSATVTGTTLLEGLGDIDSTVSPAVLAPRLLEYNPDTQTFVMALREFTDASFTQNTGRTFLVRLAWDGGSSALMHLDTTLLPTGLSGAFSNMSVVPSEHDGSLYIALGVGEDEQFQAQRVFEVDYTANAGGVNELADVTQFYSIRDAYYALPIESGLVIDGYVSGATVSRENGSGNTVTTNADGFFTGLTGTGPMIAIGGIDVVTGQPVGFTMRAPDGAEIISPLTTLVQALVDVGASSAAAYDSVAAKLGLTVTQLQSDPFATAGSEDLAVIKAAVQVASLLSAAVTEGADDVLAAQALLDTLTSASDLADKTKLESFFGDPTLEIGNAETLAETFAQANDKVAKAITVGDLQEAQSLPTVSITPSDLALKAGETATVTFTFSEEPMEFGLEDVQAENGQLTNLLVKADSGGLIYTATFTPNAAVEDTTNVITVGTGWTDSVGNAPIGVATSGNYAVDTVGAAALSDLTGQVLTRKGQALPDFEAQLTLSTLDQLDLALVQETVELDGSRTLRFALTIDSAEQAFGAFDLALRTEAGVEIVGLTLSDAFASWTSIPNPLSEQELLLGAFTTNPDTASYLSGELALGELVVRMGADYTGPLRIAVEELALGAAPVQSGVLRYESAEDLGAGQFAFLGLEDGQIDLSFMGSISNIGRSITAQDALEALRLAVRIPSDYSDAYGLISADYNQDGRVTSQDALEILKTSVRMSDAIQPKWVFLSDEADLSAVTSRTTGYDNGLTLQSLPVDAQHNFTAVLLGDVNDSLTYV